MSRYFPKNYDKYIEPFVGGGAVFFHLLPKKAILIDINEELINCYNVIKNKVYELIELLRRHKNEKEYYYEVRNLDKIPIKYNQMSEVEKASRFIYLNRCCYNGLYRVNSKGQFNVPFGKYKNPKFCDEENLINVNKALENVDLIHGSFNTCLTYARENDFVYLDPPYHPISQTSSFTGYTKENFGKDSQIELFKVFEELDKKGCILMLSNSNKNFILDLYKGFKIIFLDAKRAINSVATKRGYIKEVLVLNRIFYDFLN
jgi:DNA adenine methylase